MLATRLPLAQIEASIAPPLARNTHEQVALGLLSKGTGQSNDVEVEAVHSLPDIQRTKIRYLLIAIADRVPKKPNDSNGHFAVSRRVRADDRNGSSEDRRLSKDNNHFEP
jgi:hypothetical protein